MKAIVKRYGYKFNKNNINSSYIWVYYSNNAIWNSKDDNYFEKEKIMERVNEIKWINIKEH